ncbi:MAG: folate family ECF transporter S component [Clostridia bacterium]|nr:folate family ECF transporter S component [Clostridia bacterium]
MKEKKRNGKKLLKGGLQRLAVCALLSALSIVCGKYLAINLGPVMRFSFENLPILLAGISMGPVSGALVGLVADLLGCVLVGYTVNPLVTLGAVSIGLIGGLSYRLTGKLPFAVRVCASVVLAHLTGSVLIKTWGLAAFYDMPFYLLMAWRALNYLIVGSAEFGLLYFILKNRAIKRLLDAMDGGTRA